MSGAIALLALVVASLLGRRGPPWPTPPAVRYTPPEIPPGFRAPPPMPHDVPPPPIAPPIEPPPGEPPPVAAAPHPYTIRSGDYPSGLSQRMTGTAGRWREIMPLNPELRVTQGTTPQGAPATYVVPWQIGQHILLPADWSV